jgi:RNA polymerase sigma-70 factor, ECF subfamily
VTALQPTAPETLERRGLFTRIFTEELGYVCGSLRRMGVHPRDVEDVAHDMFVRVYAKLDAYDPARPIRPWLFGFAFRAASDYRRLARHRHELMSTNDREVDGTAPTPLAEEVLGSREEQAMVLEALDTIDLDRRAVLIAYELDECPMKDIADALQIPLATGYSRLRVAREEFAAAIRRSRLRRGES